MTEWTARALEGSPLLGEHRDYLMGRGATPKVIDEWGIKTFECPATRCPDDALAKRYGAHLETFEGRIVYPLRSPRGSLLGFDSRSVDRKDDLRFLLAESRWSPVWIGAPNGMDIVWGRGDLVIVEGRFDVFAMLHALRGRKAVWGSGPAHLSWKQVEWCRRWILGEVFLVYDRDLAGRRGVEQGLRALRGHGVKCSEVPYGASGDDPGAIWDRGGAQALQDAFLSL